MHKYTHRLTHTHTKNYTFIDVVRALVELLLHIYTRMHIFFYLPCAPLPSIQPDFNLTAWLFTSFFCLHVCMFVFVFVFGYTITYRQISPTIYHYCGLTSHTHMYICNVVDVNVVDWSGEVYPAEKIFRLWRTLSLVHLRDIR